ncbi:hypothetical protein B5F10_13150 [Anaerotruncus colihominis]|nr:hypothetical protein B5F10_13150 [Anaerotruncus colihominis]
MTSFTNGVELIDPRCLLGKHEKAAPAIGCRPFAFLHIGTICLEVRIRSAALIFLARHKTAILGATLLAGVVRQLRGTGCQPVHSRIVAVGWQVPTCGASPALDAKFASTLRIMSFHALVWHHAMRARFSIPTLGQVVPR